MKLMRRQPIFQLASLLRSGSVMSAGLIVLFSRILTFPPHFQPLSRLERGEKGRRLFSSFQFWK